MITERRFHRLLLVVFAIDAVAIGMFAASAFLGAPPIVTWIGLGLLWTGAFALVWVIWRGDRDRRRLRKLTDRGGDW